jgi:hypothetical protein
MAWAYSEKWTSFYMHLANTCAAGRYEGSAESALFKKGQLAMYTVSSAEASFDDVAIAYSVDEQ